MPTIKEIREDFSTTTADSLAAKVNSKLVRQPPKRGWTNRCVWYGNDDELMAVVSAQEESYTDIALSHGLFHRGDRKLTLVLSEAWAGPTRRRMPWLTAPIDVHTYGEALVPTLRDPMSKSYAIARAGKSDGRSPMHLSETASDWTRELTDWATDTRQLEAAHLSDSRVWSCRGQKVLAIKGKGRATITAGIDATKVPALKYQVTGPIPALKLAELQQAVLDGIGHAEAKTFGAYAEHHLQQKLRGVPWRLRLEHPLLREVPAWRPVGGPDDALGRGFIDLVGLDSTGDLVLVETKLAADDMLVLQGLDYWIWAQAKTNGEWLINRLNANPDTTFRLLYAVAGKGEAKPELSRYSRAHLEALDDSVNWRIALLSDWENDDAFTIDNLDPRSLPS